MKLKILVFDPEHSLRELLRTYLNRQGHEVHAFRDPTVCPLYRNLLDEQCCCPQERPCADAVLIDIGMPNIDALDFLRLQRRRGCKALDANKAVMSASMTKPLEEAIETFGCHHIKKPFRLEEIKGWLEECAARSAARQQPSP
ncbi:MAG: response regulator [Desulfuromonas sp.]|nr:response regulator [Desulfuromonas sp.]